MAADWTFDLPLNDADRELVLGKLRAMLVNVPSTSSCLRDVLREFENQVSCGRTRIRLRLGGLGDGSDALFGLLALSQLLTVFSPAYGEIRCPACKGTGSVKLPDSVTDLRAAFESRYHLAQMADAERSEFLEWPADKAAREKIQADRRAESARQAAAKRARENVRVLPPGSVLDEPGTGDDEDQDLDREFVPASMRGR